jgi:hypothetical protein
MEIALRRAMGEEDEDEGYVEQKSQPRRKKPENIDDLLSKTLESRPKSS